MEKDKALARATVVLELVEDMVEQTRDELEVHAGQAISLHPELAKRFDELEHAAHALLRHLQEFQP